MAKFKATIVRTVYQFAIAEVDATDENNAEEKALAVASETKLGWLDNDSDIEVIAIEEL